MTASHFRYPIRFAVWLIKVAARLLPVSFEFEQPDGERWVSVRITENRPAADQPAQLHKPGDFPTIYIYRVAPSINQQCVDIVNRVAGDLQQNIAEYTGPRPVESPTHIDQFDLATPNATDDAIRKILEQVTAERFGTGKYRAVICTVLEANHRERQRIIEYEVTAEDAAK